jgi:hypothetical protein
MMVPPGRTRRTPAYRKMIARGETSTAGSFRS